MTFDQVIAEFAEEGSLPPMDQQPAVDRVVQRQRDLFDTICLTQFIRPEQLPDFDGKWLADALRRIEPELNISQELLKEAVKGYVGFVLAGRV